MERGGWSLHGMMFVSGAGGVGSQRYTNRGRIGRPSRSRCSSISATPRFMVSRWQSGRVSMNASEPEKDVAFAFGGGSELGIAFSEVFQRAGYEVCSVDLFDSPTCDHSLCLPPGAPSRAQVSFASRMIKDSFPETPRPFSVVLNATLGYTVDDIGSEDIFESVEFMWRTNVDSSLVTAKLASKFIKPGGILAFLGSVSAFSQQTKGIAYTAGKAALHQIVRSLALGVGTDFPDDVRIIGIVPEVLDVSFHRKINGGKAEPNWTPPHVVTEKLLQWADRKSEPPENGSLVAVTSEDIEVEGQTITRHLFRLVETPSFIQSRLL